MEDILFDIYLADAYSNNDNFASPYHDYYTLIKYREAEKWIFKKYKIDSVRFESSMQYYLYHYDGLPAVYDDLFKRFEDKKKQVMNDSVAYRKRDSILHPEKIIRAKHIQDSIKKATLKFAESIQKRDSITRLKAEKLIIRKKVHKPTSFLLPKSNIKHIPLYALSF